MKKLSQEAEQVVVRTKRAVIGIECDRCKRIIKPSQYREEKSKYFSVMTGHNGWGNDSCDSIQHFDICPHCIADFMTKYITKTEYGSEYIEVETEYAYCSDYEYDD